MLLSLYDDTKILSGGIYGEKEIVHRRSYNGDILFVLWLQGQ